MTFFPFILNLLLAVIWLLFTTEPSFVSFCIGFIIGFLLIMPFNRVIPHNGYVRRTLAFLKFLYVFAKEFILSNLTIAYAVLIQKKEDIHPNFVTYDVSDLSKWEILILTHCITLTPGTTTIDIAPDFSYIIVHAFDAQGDDPLHRIDSQLRASILEFTR